jgi:hypothetical protein
VLIESKVMVARTDLTDLVSPISPNIRIDVASGNNGKWGERAGKAHESAMNGRV